MEFGEILKDIISKDFNILKRRDDFINAISESAEIRLVNALKRILRQINICEIFYNSMDKTPAEKFEIKNKVRKEILENVEIRDYRADLILDAFMYALDWKFNENFTIPQKDNTKEDKKNNNSENNPRSLDIRESTKYFAEKITGDYEKIFETDDKKVYYNFVGKYKPIRIACMNDEERSQNPALTPTFENYIHLAYFWGIRVRVKMFEVYLVYVRPRYIYDKYKHFYGGMKEAFESNYTKGAYKKFKIIRPAIFRSTKNGFEILSIGRIEF